MVLGTLHSLLILLRPIMVCRAILVPFLSIEIPVVCHALRGGLLVGTLVDRLGRDKATNGISTL